MAGRSIISRNSYPAVPEFIFFRVGHVLNDRDKGIVIVSRLKIFTSLVNIRYVQY